MTLKRRNMHQASARDRLLDFVVIGASKSGTTSLFRYLRTHPAIFIPASKDVPFFSADKWLDRGWAAIRQEEFCGAPADARWGTVTPRYMEDPRVPKRIQRLMPEIKLVALLRNPIDRALSQFRQQVRRGKESRSFEEATFELMRSDAAQRAREEQLPTGGDGTLTLSAASTAGSWASSWLGSHRTSCW